MAIRPTTGTIIRRHMPSGADEPALFTFPWAEAVARCADLNKARETAEELECRYWVESHDERGAVIAPDQVDPTELREAA